MVRYCCTRFSFQPEVTLTGLVNGNTTYTPITGAQVLVNTGAFTYTDIGGIYALILPPRVYTATASADGYMPLGFTGIELISGTVTQDFSLHPVNCPVPQILDVTVNIIDQLTLSFSRTVSSTLPVDYLWIFGDGSTSQNPDPIHTYPDYGTYTVTLDASNACGPNSWNHTLVLDRFIFLP